MVNPIPIVKRPVKRPLIIMGLSMGMTGFSLILIYLRLQNLRSLPSLHPFVETIQNQNSGMQLEEVTVNVAFFFNIAVLTTSLVPLILGIGLWNLYPWARSISICLLTSILFPNLLAAMGIVSDRGATVVANLAISLACGIGLAILFHPQIVATFRKKRRTT
jgi:uncharacterized membrane protein (DUF2068 family)